LAERLKEGLAQIPGAKLYTPRAPELSAALVSFGIEGWTGKELSRALREEWNMVIKALPHKREGLRASMAFFLLEDEIDKLLEALGSLAERRR
jgi:selenocysteine lyase/cysteine desulfurase